jgi:hypothetical protein
MYQRFEEVSVAIYLRRGKFAAGIVDNGGKFATGINNASENGGKICRRCR